MKAHFPFSEIMFTVKGGEDRGAGGNCTGYGVRGFGNFGFNGFGNLDTRFWDG